MPLITANYDVELILKNLRFDLNNVVLNMRDCTGLNIIIMINDFLKAAELS